MAIVNGKSPLQDILEANPTPMMITRIRDERVKYAKACLVKILRVGKHLIFFFIPRNGNPSCGNWKKQAC